MRPFLLLFPLFLLAVSVLAQPDAPLKGIHVCIDPGHGGQGYSVSYTGGHTGPNLDLTESKVTLDIALFLREQFRRAGAEVTMTRTRDRRVTPEGTGATEELDARRKVAEAVNADVLLSIHLSFSQRHPDLNVTRVFYNPPNEQKEIALGRAIGERLAERLGTTFQGPQEYAYQTIAEASMSAIVVEVSSLSNPEEEERLARLSYCREAAEAIFEGFQTYATRGAVTPSPPAPPLSLTEETRETRPAESAAATPPAVHLTDLSPPERGFHYLRRRPLLANPVAGRIDQAWLYGERYAYLPLQTGVSFQVPEDTLVLAAAAGVVEVLVPPGRPVPDDLRGEIVEDPGTVILSHAQPTLAGEPIWTVYSRLREIYVSPGETVAQGEVLGKTGRPYDGTPASRATAFQFEVRVGRNSVHKSVNPEPLIDHVDTQAGAIALRVLTPAGLPADGVEVRGAGKVPGHGRYGYSLTYQRGVNPHPELHENLYIADVPPGSYRLEAGGDALTVDVHAGQITHGVWYLSSTP